MSKKFSLFNLFGTIFLSSIHLPAYAQIGTVQSAAQTANVSGTNNQVYQTINQTIVNHPSRRQNDRYGKKDRRNGRRFDRFDPRRRVPTPPPEEDRGGRFDRFDPPRRGSGHRDDR